MMADGPNTVTGNVSRTHYPCAVCRELVESCRHWWPPAARQVASDRAAGRTPRRMSQREIEQAAWARAKRDVAELARTLGVDQ